MIVSEVQHKLAQWSSENSTKLFFDLYKLICHEDWLMESFMNVKRNKGSVTAGVDGLNVKDFEKDLDDNLNNIRQSLLDNSFAPYPTRRVMIPKGKKGWRPLGIPSFKDRIVQMAIKMVIEPIWESDFMSFSHGFRPQRSTHHAIRHIVWVCQNKGGGESYRWLIEGDITSYFDTVHHKKLMHCLKQRIKDKKILLLIWKFLKSGVMENKLFKASKEGIPQGGVLSPLLANIFLHELDKWMYDNYSSRRAQDKARYYELPRVSYVRYADDFVVMVKGNKPSAEEIREKIKEYLKNSLVLNLSDEKTRVTHINDGINFLGYRIIRKRQTNGKMAVVPQIPLSAVRRICNKLSDRKSGVERSIISKIMAVNSVVRGWCHYYKYATTVNKYFSKVDQVNFWTIAHWLGRKYKSSVPELMKRYYRTANFEVKGKMISCKTWIIEKSALFKATAIKHENFKVIAPKENPFLLEKVTYIPMIDQFHTLYETQSNWMGWTERLDQIDLKNQLLEIYGHKCSNPECSTNKPKQKGTYNFWILGNLELHHKRPFHTFADSKQANDISNLELLCSRCHKEITKQERAYLATMPREA